VRQDFEIPWPPTSKGRPKFVRATGVAYTPAPTRHAEAAIRDLLIARGARLFPRDVPLRVEVAFYVPRPRSAPRRVVMPTHRPDLDQYVKLLLDAATGILWEDDGQIVSVVAKKRFAGGMEGSAGPTPCQVLIVETELPDLSG
jgi:Holliday junction resolvase RusA-like endonuclease